MKQWLCGVALLVFTAALSGAQPPAPETDVGATVASAYVWRGLVLNDEAVIQPWADLRYGNVCVNLWGTWDLTDVDNASEHSRLDATAYVLSSAGHHTLGAGAVGYVYPEASDGLAKDTVEVFFGYGLDIFLLPSITVYYDLADTRGFYAAAAAAHGFELVPGRLALDLNASVGVADEHVQNNRLSPFLGTAYSTGDPVLMDLTLRAGLPIQFLDRFELEPAVRYVTLLDGDIRDAVDEAGKETDQFVVSLTARVTF